MKKKTIRRRDEEISSPNLPVFIFAHSQRCRMSMSFVNTETHSECKSKRHANGCLYYTQKSVYFHQPRMQTKNNTYTHT